MPFRNISWCVVSTKHLHFWFLNSVKPSLLDDQKTRLEATISGRDS